MKILIETDPHFKEIGPMSNESRFNPKYSTRLDLLIKSFDWLYQVARYFNVDAIVHGGDMLDKPVILAKEAHALEESFAYNTTGIKEYVLVGNHDRKDRNTHALAILANYPTVTIVDKPLKLAGGLSLLPYVSELPTEEIQALSNNVLVSHIDILGAPYNANFVSNSGFDAKLLSMYFKTILNGHIHMPSVVESVRNIGSFTGSGLGDNYKNHAPSAYLVDTETLEITVYNNPFAIQYVTIVSNDLDEVRRELTLLGTSNMHYYVRVQTLNEIKLDVRRVVDGQLAQYPNLLSAIVIGTTRRSRNTVPDTYGREQESVQIKTDAAEILAGFLTTVVDAKLPASRNEVMAMIMSDYIVGVN